MEDEIAAGQNFGGSDATRGLSVLAFFSSSGLGSGKARSVMNRASRGCDAPARSRVGSTSGPAAAEIFSGIIPKSAITVPRQVIEARD
jgi:hypothetical protein